MIKISDKYPSLKEIEKVDILFEQEKYVTLLSELMKEHKREQKKIQKTITGDLNEHNIENNINASWKRAMILFSALINGYTVEETNTYLEKSGMAKLYPRDLFDSCVIYSLKNNINAKDFEDFYNEASSFIVKNEKSDVDEITINNLKKIIKETSESGSSATVHVTDEIASMVMNCTGKEEFFRFVTNDLSPVLSETYQLQRRYVCLYLCYALMARAEEIYSFREDIKNNGTLTKEILHALNSYEEIILDDYWYDYRNIINMKIRDKITKLEEAKKNQTVRGYNFGEGQYNINAVYEVLASSLSDPFSLFKSVISNSSKNEDDIKEKIEKYKNIESIECFYDASISPESFWKFLYGVTSKGHEVKENTTNQKKRETNNGTKLKNFINGETILNRSSFILLLASITAYLDKTTYKIKNPNHKLSINRINEILINSHFAPLNTGDSVDIATLLYFVGKEKKEDDEYNYFDFFESLDIAEESKIKMIYLSEFKGKENKEKIKEELFELK